MSVTIGSARSDEHGHITGGKPGDQKGGGEVSTQAFYVHRKGWVVIRAKSDSVRKKIAKAMKAACANNNIGYNQASRNGLYNAVKEKGFDPAKCSKKVNTDCSATVRVCCAYAGIKVRDFNTESELSVLKATGKFEILRGDKYTKSSAYLKAGDILVTKTKGHTVVVLTNGSKVSSSSSSKPKPSTGGSYYKKYTGKSVKIDEVFKAIGAPYGSFTKRKPVAAKNGISGYTGTAAQNTKLINLAKAGKLKKA